MVFAFFVLDLFHHESKGIFALLDDECKLLKPTNINFALNLKNKWEKDPVSIMWNASGQISANIFTIRHFSSDVRYSTVGIIQVIRFRLHSLSN